MSKTTTTQMIEKEKHDHVRDLLDQCVSSYDVTYHKDGTDVVVYTHGDSHLYNRMSDWLPGRVPDEFSVYVRENSKSGIVLDEDVRRSGSFQYIMDTLTHLNDIKFNLDNENLAVQVIVYDENINVNELHSILMESKPTGWDIHIIDDRLESGNKEEVGDYTIINVDRSVFVDPECREKLLPKQVLCREIVGDNNHYYCADGDDFYSRNHVDAVNYIDGKKKFESDDEVKTSSDDGSRAEEEKDIWSELPTDKRVMWTNQYQEQGHIMATITDYEESGDTVTYVLELPWGDTVNYTMDISTFEQSGNLARFTEQHGYEENQYKSLVGEETEMIYTGDRWKVQVEPSGEEFEDSETLLKGSISFDIPVYARPVVVGVLALISIACVLYLSMIGAIGTPMVLGLNILILVLQWRLSR